MNESLNVKEQERMLNMLNEKLQNPENYTQEEVERIKNEMKALRNRRSALDSQRRELKKKIKELENAEPSLIAERVELEEEYPELEQALADVQTELINMPLGPSPEIAVSRSNELQAKRESIMNKMESLDLRLAQISTELNLRSQKESRLAHLDVAVDKLNSDYEVLSSQSDPSTLPLDLVNNKVGRDRYISDYERLYGLKMGLELRQKIQNAQDNNEPLFVYPQGIEPQIETKLEEIAITNLTPELEAIPELPLVTGLEPLEMDIEEPRVRKAATPVSITEELEPSADVDTSLEPTDNSLIEEEEDQIMEEILLVDGVEDIDEEERLTLWGRFKESNLGRKIAAVGLAAAVLMALYAGFNNGENKNITVEEPPQSDPGIEMPSEETSTPEAVISISDEDINRAMAGEQVEVVNDKNASKTHIVDYGDYTSNNNLMEEPNNGGSRDHNEDVGPGNDNQTPKPGDEQVGPTPEPPAYEPQPIPDPILPPVPETPVVEENEIFFEDPILQDQSFESSSSVRVR